MISVWTSLHRRLRRWPLLRYSRATIYEMLNSGELPSTRHGASRRIPVMALRAWVEAHTEHGL